MTDILDILNERKQTHGDFAKVADTAQDLKNVISKHDRLMDDLHRESLDMICSKIARICNGNPMEVDHWRDIAGYAMLVVGELEKS
jgi:hypothetical protein